jgi:predicted ferric reductase
MSPYILLPAYLVIALLPLALAWAQGLPPRPIIDELSSAIALVGFSVLLMEFVLSGRFRTVSGRIGIDKTMHFHQVMARPLTLFLLLHPFLYSTPLAPALPWDASNQLTLGLDGWAVLSGLAAWALLAAVVASAILRDHLPFRYEAWRFSHGIGAVLIALFALHHALEAGRYSNDPALTWLWLILVALAMLTVISTYVLRPLAHLRAPYRVASNRRVGLKIWELTVEPAGRAPLSFKPGQFVWLTLDRSPFSLCEHPFSIASAPGDKDGVAFVIKQVGDFTNRIGAIKPGASAYLDGPHGSLVLGDRPADGITFIAGGVGIAPILSMLRQAALDGDTRPMTLLYGNRVAEQILYADELAKLQETLTLDITHVLTEPPDDWDGETGVLDSSTIARLCGAKETSGQLFVICGPPPMIDGTEAALKQLGVPARQILSEKFSYG